MTVHHPSSAPRRRRCRPFLLAASTLAVTVVLASATGIAWAVSFTVDSTADAPDSTPGDGQCASQDGPCTLRAAIQESNALAGADDISLPAGMYTLSRDGGGEDAAATGDLDITDDLTITGSSTGATTVSGDLDRIFDVLPTAHVTLSTMTLQNGLVASGDGGGIRNAGSLALDHMAIRNNTAQAGDGGGIANLSGGVLQLSNVTVSGNEAFNRSGGGIDNATGAILQLSNVTISSNRAASGGGVHNFGMATLHNTLIALASQGGTCAGSLVLSLGHNLDASNLCHLNGPADLVNTDPKLQPLSPANGGFTFTHALPMNSPAVDAGDDVDCPSTDQRGDSRPTDGNNDGEAHCDIGAYEAPGPLAATPTPTPGPPTQTPTETPSPTQTVPTATVVPGASLELDGATGLPGDQVTVTVTLHAAGASVVGANNEIAFGPNTAIDALPGSGPNCTANPDLGKSAVFSFKPFGCSPSNCTRVFAALFSFGNPIELIPDGAVLYTCQVNILASAAAGTYPLIVDTVVLSDAEGSAVPGSGMNGSVLVLAPPTATPTATVTATGTATATATETRTETPVATPTQSPQPCTGDCNGNGSVSPEELLQLVNATLGNPGVAPCGSGAPLRIDGLLVAVNSAVTHCGTSAEIAN